MFQLAKSVALSREVVSTSGGGAAEVLTASTGAGIGVGAVAAGRGVVEAKRIPAPFRNKIFVLEKLKVASALGSEEPLVERSVLGRVGPRCTLEENWHDQQLREYLDIIFYMSDSQRLYTLSTCANGLAGPAQASAGYHFGWWLIRPE